MTTRLAKKKQVSEEDLENYLKKSPPQKWVEEEGDYKLKEKFKWQNKQKYSTIR